MAAGILQSSSKKLLMKPDTNEKAYQLPDRLRTKELYESLHPHHEEQLRKIYRRIRLMLEQHGFSPTIKYRIKRFDEYYEKLLRSARKRQGEPSITDLLGLRIICPFLEDVEMVEHLVKNHFDVVEVVRKASGHSFREFGYDSVHLLVRVEESENQFALPHTRRVCEVQLRTTLQDAWAEVEHELIYKSRISLPNESIRRKLAALNATLTLSDLTFQEIRDYQKGILELNLKRRKALDNAIQLPDIDLIIEKVETPLNESLPLSPVHGTPLEKRMLEALSAHSDHRFDRAVELYSKILSMRMNRKNRSLIYNHRGMALFALSRPSEALRDFSRAIDFDKEYLRAYCNRGLVHRAQNRLNKALEDYNRALEIDDSCCDALLGRAQTWLRMAFPDQALTDCEKALAICPDLPAAKNLFEKIRRDFFSA
jgi:putative GTP pyrophosphokinase